MFEKFEEYTNDVMDWFKKLFQIIAEFLADIGVEM